MPKAWNHTQNGWGDRECLDYSVVTPCIKLSEGCCLSAPVVQPKWEGTISMKPKAVFWQDSALFESTGLPKMNVVVLHWQNSFLLFSGKLEQPLAVGNGKGKNELRLKACAFLEKQDVLGREQVQAQEGILSLTPPSRCCSVAVWLEPVYLWQIIAGVFHCLLHRTTSYACRSCGCFDNCILNLSGNKGKNLVLRCYVCLMFYL